MMFCPFKSTEKDAKKLEVSENTVHLVETISSSPTESIIKTSILLSDGNASISSGCGSLSTISGSERSGTCRSRKSSEERRTANDGRRSANLMVTISPPDALPLPFAVLEGGPILRYKQHDVVSEQGNDGSEKRSPRSRKINDESTKASDIDLPGMTSDAHGNQKVDLKRLIEGVGTLIVPSVCFICHFYFFFFCISENVFSCVKCTFRYMFYIYVYVNNSTVYQIFYSEQMSLDYFSLR